MQQRVKNETRSKLIGGIMERDFEKFDAGPAGAPGSKIRVTISPKKRIYLSSLCYKELGRPPAFYLHYSKTRNVIALEPCPSVRFHSAFPVSREPTARLYAASFFKHFGIHIEATCEVVRTDIVEGKLLLYLDHTIVTRRTKPER